MKSEIAQIFLAATLLGSVSSFGQSTATSDPVGFVNKSGTAATDVTFSPTLQRAAAFVGTIAEITSPSVIKVSGTPNWAVNSFATTHYALVGSGDREGLFAEISANTADSLTLTYVVGNLGSVLGDKVNVGDQIKVIPFWTLSALLPDGQVPDGTIALLYDRSQSGINRAASHIYTMFSGFGWYDGPTEGNAQTIYPDESIVIRVPVGQTLNLSHVGTVPMDRIRTALQNVTPGQDQDIRITTGTPIPVTLASFLNPGAPADGDIVLIFDDSAPGINKAASFVVTYYNGFGWYDGPTDMNGHQLQPGQGIVYRKAGANSANTLYVTFKPSYQP